MAEPAELRELHLGDLSSIWSLCRRYFEDFGELDLPEFESVFRHRWVENPNGGTDRCLGWVLVAGTDVVGFLGLVPQRFKIGDVDVVGASGTSWAMEEGHRGRSFDMYKRYMDWADDHFLVDTTASDVAAKLHVRLKRGMSKVPVPGYPRRFLWFLQPEVLVRWRLERRFERSSVPRSAAGLLPRGVLAAPSRVMLARHRRIRYTTQGLDIEPVTACDEEWDGLWERVSPQYELAVVRDRRWVEWRHLRLPSVRGVVGLLACRERGKLLGYTAVQHKRHPKTPPAHFVLTDLLYDRRREDVLKALLGAAYGFVRQAGGSVLEVSGFSRPVMAELQTQRPYVLENPVWTYWYKAPESLAEVCRRAEWWPTGVDGDTHL